MTAVANSRKKCRWRGNCRPEKRDIEKNDNESK